MTVQEEYFIISVQYLGPFRVQVCHTMKSPKTFQNLPALENLVA